MGTPLAGFEGRVEVAGLVLNLDYWRVNPRSGEIPSVNFESVVAGVCYDEGLFGVTGADVEFGGYWDADQNPHGNPPNLRVGVYLVNLYLYVRKTGNRRFWFPSFRIYGTPVQASAKENTRVEVAVQGKSHGIFYYPT